jgi:guanylate kinase
MPSSLNDLKQRLIKRGQDTYENIEKRINTAETEIKFSQCFDQIILSKSKDEDYQKLNDFYLKHSKLAKN